MKKLGQMIIAHLYFLNSFSSKQLGALFKKLLEKMKQIELHDLTVSVLEPAEKTEVLNLVGDEEQKLFTRLKNMKLRPENRGKSVDAISIYNSAKELKDNIKTFSVERIRKELDKNNRLMDILSENLNKSFYNIPYLNGLNIIIAIGPIEDHIYQSAGCPELCKDFELNKNFILNKYQAAISYFETAIKLSQDFKTQIKNPLLSYIETEIQEYLAVTYGKRTKFLIHSEKDPFQAVTGTERGKIEQNLEKCLTTFRTTIGSGIFLDMQLLHKTVINYGKALMCTTSHHSYKQGLEYYKALKQYSEKPSEIMKGIHLFEELLKKTNEIVH